MLRRLLAFFRHGLWAADLRECSAGRRLWLGALRVVGHVIASYDRHLVGIRAGGLTLVTLLSIVPLLAIAFSLADAFEFRELLDQWIQSNVSDLPAELQQAVSRIEALVDRTSFKALGFVGTLVLVWSAMSLFSRLEQSLNFAWRSHASRALIRRITRFLALLLVVPVLAVGSVLLSSALSSSSLVEELRAEIPYLMKLYDAGLFLLPHVMASVALFALYLLMPNTSVDWRAAAVGGVLAGFGLMAMNGVYVHFQIGVARANAIYATLAAVPLLLIYLQLTWTVVLLGAEVGYAVQNVDRLGPEQGLEGMTWAVRERLAASLVENAVEHFDRGDGAFALARFAADLDVSRDWIDAAASDLEQAEIVTRVGDDAILPLRPGSRITVGDVQSAVRGRVPAQVRKRIPLSRSVEDSIDESRPPEPAFRIALDAVPSDPAHGANPASC